MIDDILNRLEKKETLRLTDDYVPLRMELEKIDTSIAERLRDDIWLYNPNDTTKQGKWHGVGLGNIPAKDICNHVRELLQA